MYKHYYVNPSPQSTGENEVHEEGCVWLSKIATPVYLGFYTNCHDAVTKAKSLGYDADGCYYCCFPCHKR